MSQAMRYSPAGGPPRVFDGGGLGVLDGSRDGRIGLAARAQALEVVSDGDHRHRHRLAQPRAVLETHQITPVSRSICPP